MVDNYSASDISVLKGLEAVRKRPGMYIGETNVDGLIHCVKEIVDNSVDEALAGFCDLIEIELTADGYVRVSDNGRGIPVDIHPEEGVSAATLVYTTLHAGGKFDDEGNGSYKVSGGLHGVGASVVNALSSHLILEVEKNGSCYIQEFEKGIPLYDLKVDEGKSPTGKNGTTVKFKPDPEMFKNAIEEQGDLSFPMAKIKPFSKTTSYLIKGLRIRLISQEGEAVEFYSENGIADLVDENVGEAFEDRVTDNIYFVTEENGVYVEFCSAFTKDHRITKNLSFVNNINTNLGGTHVTALNQALLRAVSTYATTNLSEFSKFTVEDILEGSVSVLSIRLSNPEFSSQTKDKLTSSDARKATYSVTKDFFEKYLEENPEHAKNIVKKTVASMKARLAAEKTRDEVKKDKNISSFSGLPGKLADCQTKDKDISEIYIVEGDSAGGSAKQGRDRFFQAILPLRGKVLNSSKNDYTKISDSEQIANLVSALGTDLGEDFNFEKLRYGKIIIMTDADVDGSHIAILLLTLFFKHMRGLVDNGVVYFAMPPLYRLRVSKGGKTMFKYAYDDKDLKQKQSEFKSSEYTRFKGLGEMSATDLWDTTMNPETRRLQKVNLDSYEEVLRVFDVLMGSDVEPRREFLEANIKYDNLEV